MQLRYTLSKSGNRININTFKRAFYPRYYFSFRPSRKFLPSFFKISY